MAPDVAAKTSDEVTTLNAVFPIGMSYYYLLKSAAGPAKRICEKATATVVKGSRKKSLIKGIKAQAATTTEALKPEDPYHGVPRRRTPLSWKNTNATAASLKTQQCNPQTRKLGMAPASQDEMPEEATAVTEDKQTARKHHKESSTAGSFP